jgi:hypothetical protein
VGDAILRPWALADLATVAASQAHVADPLSSDDACRVWGLAAEGIERAKLRYGDERFDVETHARLATDPAPAVMPLGVVG